MPERRLVLADPSSQRSWKDMRTGGGPPLDEWVLRSLWREYRGDLLLVWRDDLSQWDVRTWNRPLRQWVTLDIRDHATMDRRLLSDLRSWDTRNHRKPKEHIGAMLDAQEKDALYRKKVIRERRDMGPVIAAGRKVVNELASYPRIMPMFPGASLAAPTAPSGLVLRPTAKESLAVGLGAGRVKP